MFYFPQPADSYICNNTVKPWNKFRVELVLWFLNRVAFTTEGKKQDSNDGRSDGYES